MVLQQRGRHCNVAKGCLPQGFDPSSGAAGMNALSSVIRQLIVDMI